MEIEDEQEQIEHGQLVRRKRLLLAALNLWELKQGLPRHMRCCDFTPQDRKRKPERENQKGKQDRMKTGRTLAEVLTQVKAEQKEKRDFIMPTTKLRYDPDKNDQGGVIRFNVAKRGYEATPTNHCLRQIAARSHIPATYVDRMKGEHADLLAQNINHWWKRTPEPRMLRTLLNGSHKARAFLSDGYRPLENSDLAAIILPKLEALNCDILSCEMTETRFYIQAATPKVQAKMVGDVVRAGAVIGNSEVGLGSLFLDPMIYTLSCLNGAIMPRIMGRHHIGRRRGAEEDLDKAREYYTDATKEMDDRAFWMKVNDVADGLFDKDRFKAMVDKFSGAAAQRVKPVEAVEEMKQRFLFSEKESDDILNHFIEGGRPNVYGLINAVTRTATDVESYDRSIELQRVGGQILELPKSVWTTLGR